MKNEKKPIQFDIKRNFKSDHEADIATRSTIIAF